MIVGVTGATSRIGELTIGAVRAAGHHPVAFVRNPRNSDERKLDLKEPIAESILEGIDALIHVAWSWDSSPGWRSDPNRIGGAELARACVSSGVRPVLLSTYSVFAASSSAYGAAKRDVESEFIAAHGVALRAGLIWGGTPSGMV